MSTSLLEQLDTYFDQVDAGQAPITTREVEDRLGAGEVKPSLAATSRRGLLVAAAAALIVLLLGVIPFLIRGDGGSPVDDPEPPPTTVVTETTLAPTTTVAPPTTEAPVETEVTQPSDIFGYPAGVTIRNHKGDDITRELTYIDGYVKALDSGTPDPRFDTEPLGTEQVLIALGASVEEGASVPLPGSVEVWEQPILAAVGLPDSDAIAQFGVYLEFESDSETPEWVDLEWGLDVVGVGPPIGMGIDQFDPPDWASLLLVLDLQQIIVFGGLPPEAAVVTTTFEDGARVWQRPTSGLALFTHTARVCELEPTGGEACSRLEFIVLDASGVEMLRIVTPLAGSDHEHIVILPNGDTYIR